MTNKGYRLDPSADAGCFEVTCRRIAVKTVALRSK